MRKVMVRTMVRMVAVTAPTTVLAPARKELPKSPMI